MKQARKTRLIVLAVEAGGLIIVTVLLARFGRPVVWAAAAAAAMLLLARFGRPLGHRIIGPAVVPPMYEEPTQDRITEALGSLGIKNINDVIKEGRGLQFVSPVMQSGPGWNVQLDLPRGVTAGHIMERRPELASALRRPLSATWPGGVPSEHEGRLELWVGFDILKTKPPRYPLMVGDDGHLHEHPAGHGPAAAAGHRSAVRGQLAGRRRAGSGENVGAADPGCQHGPRPGRRCVDP